MRPLCLNPPSVSDRNPSHLLLQVRILFLGLLQLVFQLIGRLLCLMLSPGHGQREGRRCEGRFEGKVDVAVDSGFTGDIVEKEWTVATQVEGEGGGGRTILNGGKNRVQYKRS